MCVYEIIRETYIYKFNEELNYVIIKCIKIILDDKKKEQSLNKLAHTHTNKFHPYNFWKLSQLRNLDSFNNLNK